MKKWNVKKMVVLAMLAALAFIAVAAIHIPVVMFLKYEPKDVIIAIAGFLFGPMEAFAVTLVVAFVEMVTISDTGLIGFVMNLLSSCSFACTAAFVYKRRHTLGGALAGLCAGTALTVGAMLLWNWLITPLYMQNTSRDQVAAMLVPVFLPFNLLKAGLNSALTLCLYKPLVTALRKTGLAEETKGGKGFRMGIFLIGGLLLATCILLLLVYTGKL